MSERQRRAAAADARKRFTLHPMWVNADGQLQPIYKHPHYDVCRELLRRPFGPPIAAVWHDPVAFVYGSTLAAGLRPSDYHYLLPTAGGSLRPNSAEWVLPSAADYSPTRGFMGRDFVSSRYGFMLSARGGGEEAVAELEAADAAERAAQGLRALTEQPDEASDLYDPAEDGGPCPGRSALPGRSSPLLDCLCDLGQARGCPCLLGQAARLDLPLLHRRSPGGQRVGVPPGWPGSGRWWAAPGPGLLCLAGGRRPSR